MIVHLLICRDWDKSKGTPPTAHELLPLITDNVKIDQDKGKQLKQKIESMREFLKSRQ